ncbi:hypothetical protein RQ831_06830 [Roseomonas gilardii]|uniref:Uncharacterized protein n=1 Tax=Roseomonas gilardii TaxID=257708 RepID=A0ABU3ME64_9PROT|nr:hypothetical protein [Roseomonas gilardii]MDT8330761.1 hypothetical protein [Roseomonas gilardii]
MARKRSKKSGPAKRSSSNLAPTRRSLPESKALTSANPAIEHDTAEVVEAIGLRRFVALGETYAKVQPAALEKLVDGSFIKCAPGTIVEGTMEGKERNHFKVFVSLIAGKPIEPTTYFLFGGKWRVAA